MGLVKLTPTEPNYRWDMLNERKYGGISCISTWDITGDGLADIIVGRDDGVVEVYGFEDNDEPRLQFTHVSPACRGEVSSRRWIWWYVVQWNVYRGGSLNTG